MSKLNSSQKKIIIHKLKNSSKPKDIHFGKIKITVKRLKEMRREIGKFIDKEIQLKDEQLSKISG